MKKILIGSLFLSIFNCSSMQIVASDQMNNEYELIKKKYADGLQQQLETKLWYVSKAEQYNRICMANSRAILHAQELQSQEEIEKQRAIFLKEEQSLLQAIVNVAFKHHEKASCLENLSQQLNFSDRDIIEINARNFRIRELQSMKSELKDIANTYYLSNDTLRNSLSILYKREFNK